jgi:hypothetical protein
MVLRPGRSTLLVVSALALLLWGRVSRRIAAEAFTVDVESGSNECFMTVAGELFENFEVLPEGEMKPVGIKVRWEGERTRGPSCALWQVLSAVVMMVITPDGDDGYRISLSRDLLAYAHLGFAAIAGEGPRREDGVRGLGKGRGALLLHGREGAYGKARVGRCPLNRALGHHL